MKWMSGSELREAYLQFFVRKGHLKLPSASLIPENDPTLLMIGAGMAPFKPFFTGKMKPPCGRIVTSQRCVRTGDIEHVGRTARHQTFFEMLGNFSFGDYFKRDAIHWAWEFLTVELELPADKLWVTIYPDDEEAYKIWVEEVGLDPSRVVKLQDNFWEIGPGPCGPCSEIYVDLGEKRGCDRPDCAVGCDCDRFLEIWNLVFTQFDKDEEGKYAPLAKKNIDTGAGLERLASVLQGKKSNFETDLLYPIIEYASGVSGVAYGQDEVSDVSLKVIADHARSMTIMILDGIQPSNEGRGYVLRRIIRRAIRHGRLIGIESAFMTGAVEAVIEIFGEVYPELVEKRDYIKKVIGLEEERFHATLAQGIALLNHHVNALKQAGEKVLSGEQAFKLYDTFGFPWELTSEILSENGMTLDKAAFDAAMQAQRARARAARQENQRISIPDLSDLDTERLTSDSDAVQAKIVCVWQDGKMADAARDGEEAGIILDVTPFYAEGGGQVGDAGRLVGELGKISVLNTKKLPNGTIYHIAYVEEGVARVGDTVQIVIDRAIKRATARNHTATHLLHAALKRVVGDHVNQAGSSVGPDRLRFDFSHVEPVAAEQLREVERVVTDVILSAARVDIVETTRDEAKAMGATALFGEKYGARVRVVSVGDYSMELCGGTHVENVSEIGLFKITGESGVASGVRRIEAVTGAAAVAFVNRRFELLQRAADMLRTSPEEVTARLEGVLANVKSMEQSLHEMSVNRAKADAEKLLAAVKEIGGVPVVLGEVSASDINELRQIADFACEKVADGAVVLAAVIGGKVNFVAKASKVAVARGVHAGNIVKAAAKVAGGGGGGRPDMAQAGGKLPEKLAEAITAAGEAIKAQLK